MFYEVSIMNTYIGKLPPWFILCISLIFAVEMIDAAEKSAPLFDSVNTSSYLISSNWRDHK